MIHLSDLTIIEAYGNFGRVKDIMLAQDGVSKWMLVCDVTVVTQDCTHNYLIHFWDSGDAVIKATDHPPTIAVHDTDIRELKAWTDEGGWRLCIDDRLIVDQVGFLFWLQKFREGLLHSDKLQNYETDEMKRMSAALEEERREEGERDAD
jgi:hypothetical protein